VQIRGSGQSTEVRNREEWKSNAQRVAPPDVAEGHAPPVSIALCVRIGKDNRHEL